MYAYITLSKVKRRVDARLFLIRYNFTLRFLSCIMPFAENWSSDASLAVVVFASPGCSWATESTEFQLSVGVLDANKRPLLNLYTGCCRIKWYCTWADYVCRELSVGVAEIR